MTAAPATASVDTPAPAEAASDARFSNTFLRLKKKLERGVGEAIGDYNMIGDGDTVMVCVSGGKDSYTLLSCLLALRAAGGAIVNIVDIHAERPLTGYTVYNVAKGGLATLTRALAIDLAPEVRVNGVAPGPIDWPEDGQFPPEERQRIIAHTLLKRVGSPADIARTVRFLMLDAPYITGQIIAVDGGRSVHL